MDELITYLRDKTHLARFSRGEIRELIERMEQDCWQIVRKIETAVGAIEPVAAEPVAVPVAEPEPDIAPGAPAEAPIEPVNDEASAVSEQPVEPEFVGPIIPHD